MTGIPSDPTAARNFDALVSAFQTRFADGVAPWSPEEFGDRALLVFRHQFEGCDTYRALCERRGVTPRTVAAWEDVPPVPATAFRYFDFVSGPRDPNALVFRTSGTTRGTDQRGRHVVLRPDLYRASLLAPFEDGLLSDGLTRIAFLSLIPSHDQAPDSSLSFMVSAAAERLATETHWIVDADGSIDEDRLTSAMDQAREAGEPVLVLGTAAAFVHALDLGASGLTRLPPESRIMETGGFKGARRSISRGDLYRAISSATGLPTERIVNEYGMTELLSQLYEPVLREGAAAAGAHVPPPWLRVRSLDPTTLRPVPEGQRGILAFYDLANLGSVSHILTEDIGSVVDGRVRLEGRAHGAEPRGCSRAMDELMTVAKAVR